MLAADVLVPVGVELVSADDVLVVSVVELVVLVSLDDALASVDDAADVLALAGALACADVSPLGLDPSLVVEDGALLAWPLESLDPVLALPPLGAVDAAGAGADELADASELAGVLLVSAGVLLVSAGVLLVSAGVLLVSAGASLVAAGALLLAAGALLLVAAGALLLVAAGALLAVAAGALLLADGALLLAAGVVCASGVAGAAALDAAEVGAVASGLGADVVGAAAPLDEEPLDAVLARAELAGVDWLVSLTRTVFAGVELEREDEARSTAVLTVAAFAIFVPHTRPDECWPSRLLISDSIREPAPIEPGG